MDRDAAPFATPNPAFTAWLKDESRRAAAHRQRLLVLSALLVLGEEN